MFLFYFKVFVTNIVNVSTSPIHCGFYFPFGVLPRLGVFISVKYLNEIIRFQGFGVH